MDLSDLKSFAHSLKEKFAIVADAAWPEDQLKSPVAKLLEVVGNRYGLAQVR